MAFIAGILMLDAPASALNNSNRVADADYDNEVGVKMIRTKGGALPYVSAQSFRFWLRNTLEQQSDWAAHAAPIFRENKAAYTDANPLKWWDDDLFGYMRAESKKTSAIEAKTEDTSRASQTETKTSITRTSPFRMSTLVSIAPVSIVKDFGTMSRHEGDPVPHAHQFYRATLKGLFSLDLNRAGTFSYRDQSGSRNLDEVRIQAAKGEKLEHNEGNKEYRLPLNQRTERVAALLMGLAHLEGGAKQALHYTDVTPAIVISAVFKGGNNPLHYVVGADEKGRPMVHVQALEEALQVWGDSLLSGLYVGWVQGFHDEERARLETALTNSGAKFQLGHPRAVLTQLAKDIQDPANAHWLE
ncbi:MAG: type I-B CRISPR-associated protein Cas7/Cst2/DevR [Thermaceae bacterium]|nr:type I-B CRISPR-associated protein Cas7/Cst2/DevR [Thermaceae bacterium]